MAGLRDSHLVEAYRRMHARGVTTTTLAEQLCTSRAYVSRVLTGHERRGRTWERIRALLTPEERELLEAVPEHETGAGVTAKGWSGRLTSVTVANGVSLHAEKKQGVPTGETAPAATLLKAAAVTNASPDQVGAGTNFTRRAVDPTAAAFHHWRHHQHQ